MGGMTSDETRRPGARLLKMLKKNLLKTVDLPEISPFN